MNDKLKLKLRSSVLKLSELTNIMDQLQTSLAEKKLEFREVLGAQKALADLFLEGEMSLQEAWDSNHNNLRTEDD
tara:strand:- start:3227 stop:3451 length:225 start_codon:yes stop_codon:yes gene_type:complete